MQSIIHNYFITKDHQFFKIVINYWSGLSFRTVTHNVWFFFFLLSFICFLHTLYKHRHLLKYRRNTLKGFNKHQQPTKHLGHFAHEVGYLFSRKKKQLVWITLLTKTNQWYVFIKAHWFYVMLCWYFSHFFDKFLYRCMQNLFMCKST